MGMNRRRFLVASGVAGLAGCTSHLSDIGTDEGEPSGDDGPSSSPGDGPTDDDHDERGSGVESLLEFKDLDPWEAIAGDLSADAEAETGSQSARINVGPGEEWARIDRPLELDFSDHRLTITCRVHAGGAPSQSIDVIVEDAAEHSLRFRTQVFETGSEAGFYRLHAGTYDLRTTEAPDLGVIERIRIQPGFEGYRRRRSGWTDWRRSRSPRRRSS